MAAPAKGRKKRDDKGKKPTGAITKPGTITPQLDMKKTMAKVRRMAYDKATGADKDRLLNLRIVELGGVPKKPQSMPYKNRIGLARAKKARRSAAGREAIENGSYYKVVDKETGITKKIPLLTDPNSRVAKYNMEDKTRSLYKKVRNKGRNS